MRVLVESHWSFGRDRILHRKFQETVAKGPFVHDLFSDPDWNRTIAVFSAEFPMAFRRTIDLCSSAFQSIDLRQHAGSYPRLGALDRCHFVLAETDQAELLEPLMELVQGVAREIADRFQVPVFLDQRSERPRPESELDRLRKGGFGSLEGRHLPSDFGPAEAHPRLGASFIGVRSAWITWHSTFETEDRSHVDNIAAMAKQLRAEGDSRFLGVRARPFVLPTARKTLIRFTSTLPDLAPADPIALWLEQQSSERGLAVAETRLVGAIRKRDVKGSARLVLKPEQVVEAD